MTTALMSFNKNPNIGLYGFATNKHLLLGREIDEKTAKELEKIFEVPVHRISIAGTSLIGAFIVGNEEVLLVPGITFESELKALDKLKIRYEVLKTDLTCLGNNIVLNENGALVNPNFIAKDINRIKEIFDVPVEKITIADTETPGACVVLNNEKALIHRDSDSGTTKLIEKILKVKTFSGTINMGVPYIKSGVICNKSGLIIGEISGPAEIMNVEEVLGFIEG